MAYKVKYTKNFTKDIEKCRKRGYDMSRLKSILDTLIETGSVPPVCRPHKLSGNHEGEWEPMEQREQSSLLEICRVVTEEDECQCHIGADWLMIWEQNDTELTLLMLSTGTHSDLF